MQGIASAAATLRGQVTITATGVPVEGARVTLDLEPPDLVVESASESSPFGFYQLGGIPAGSYRWRVEHPAYSPHEETITVSTADLVRNIALTPLGGNRFDIFVQVSDVTSGLQLGGVPVVLERYATALDTSAQFTANLVTDTNGFGAFRGLSDGHYRFVVNGGGSARPKWEFHESMPVSAAKPLLTKAHMANVLLKAVPQELHVQVIGYNPATRLNGLALTNFFVELTGLDPQNTNRVIVPTRAGVTGDDGKVKFDRLPAIAWVVRAKKMGYNPVAQVLFPNASGDFDPGNAAGNPLVLTANIIPTHLYVDTTHPYEVTPLFDFLNMRIEGLTNTTADGVVLINSFYNYAPLRDDRNFEFVLPGRYHVRMNGRPQFGFQGIHPHFVAEDYVDVPPGNPANGGYTDLILPLNVVPAPVRGRLFVADEAGRAGLNPGTPRYVPRAEVAVEIIEFSTDQLLKPAFRTNVVTTDANGEFTVNLLPAHYGIRIPTLTGYYGREVRLRNLTTTLSTEQNIVQSWPYPEPWPWTGGLHGDPLILRSGEDYRLDLFVEKQVAAITTFISTQALGGDGTVTATLRSLPGNEVVQSFQVPFDGVVRFFDVPPGMYTYSFERPWFTFGFNNVNGFMQPTPTPVTWNALPAPGVIPPADPNGTSYIEPFSVINGDSVDYTFTNGTATVEVNIRRWSGTNYLDPYTTSVYLPRKEPDNPGLVPGGTQPDGGFSFWAQIPMPTGADTYYSNHVNSPNGVHTFDVYTGVNGVNGVHGPQGNVVASLPALPVPTYDWTIRMVNFDDPDQLITNVTSFTITSGTTDFPHTVSGVFFTNINIGATAGFFSNPQWAFNSQTTYYLTNNARLTIARFQRATAVSGGVTNDTTNLPIPNAKVQVKDRFGRVLRDALADGDGLFAFAQKLNADPVFLDITAPGFKPYRARFTSADAVPVPEDLNDSTLAVNARLEPIFPSPVIQNLTLDRQGLFLPGVKLAGNQSALSAFQAVGPLTLTWTVLAKSDPVNASLVPFDAANGTASGSQNLILQDPIQEVWLIDPRGFTNSAYSGEPIPLPPPTGQGYQAMHAWLQNIVTNRLTNVYYLRVTNLFATGQSGQVTTTNTVPIWKLPPGDFKPVFVAVTQRGAVAVTNPFETPGTPPQLKGVRIPRWLAFAADVMGAAAGVATTQDKVKEWVPEGQFVPLPEFTAEIAADENGFLHYDYNLAVEWTAAEDTPGSGLLALAPGLLGLQFNGNVNFGLNGAGTNLFLDARADLTQNDVRLPNFFPKAATNSALLKNIEVEESTLHVEARTLAAQNFAPATQPYEFELTNSVGGSYTAALKANLKPITGKLPYIGPVLLTLDQSDKLKISGVLDAGIGLKRTNTWRTPFPPSIDPDTSLDLNKHVMRRHFLGGTEREQTLALCFRFGTGIDVSAFNGRGNARAKLNLQGNNCALGPGDAAKPAAQVEFNPDNDWPVIRRISGNLTATLDASVSAWIVQIGKSWKWELLSFEHSFNTEPFFELIPMNISTTVLSPGTATPSAFNGAGPLIISNFYAAGSFATTRSGNNEALAFTEIDIATGNMRLKVALRTEANPFGVPVTVATAAGIVAVDIAALPAGGWMAVWTQLSPGDVGNPFPPSAVMSATSADGTAWAAPVPVAALTDVASDLRLLTGSSLVGLAWLRTSGGPEGGSYTLEVARWNGSTWDAAATLLTDAAIGGFDALGAGPASAQPAVLAVNDSTGQLKAFTWDGVTVTGPTLVTNIAAASLSLATAGAGVFHLAWEPLEGGIGIFRFDTTNGWASLGVPLTNAFPSELRLTPLEHGGKFSLLLTWVEGGDVTSVWTAFFGVDGALLRAPANLTVNTAGRFARLEVLPRANREARILARYEDGRVDVLELAAAFGSANALLDAPRLLVDGSFEFRFTGNPQQVYTIQASPDLLNWFILTNFAAPTNGVYLLDPGAKALPYRFYRAVSP